MHVSWPTSLLELGLTSSSILLQSIPSRAVMIDNLDWLDGPHCTGPPSANVKGNLARCDNVSIVYHVLGSVESPFSRET